MAGRKRKRTRRRSGQLGHVTTPMLRIMEVTLGEFSNQLDYGNKTGNEGLIDRADASLDAAAIMATKLGAHCSCISVGRHKSKCFCAMTMGELHKKVQAQKRSKRN